MKIKSCEFIVVASNIFWIVVVVILSAVLLSKKDNFQMSMFTADIDTQPTLISNDNPPKQEQAIEVYKQKTIPKIIHFVFIDKENENNENVTLSELYQNCKKKVSDLNPDYKIKLWNGKMCKELIATHYPWFLKYYESFPSFIFKVDAIRLFILHFEGGVYMDLDITCVKQIPYELINRDVLLFVNENVPDTGIIGGARHHKFFSVCIQTLFFEYINETRKVNKPTDIHPQRTQDCCGALLIAKVCSKMYGCIPKNVVKVTDYFEQYKFENYKFTTDPVFVNHFSQSWNIDKNGDSITGFRPLQKETDPIFKSGYYCEMAIFNS
jgi:hypothetical protein